MLLTEKIVTETRTEFIDITHLISGAAKKSGIEQGIATIFIPHTTAGVTINENGDPDVKWDLLMSLKQMVPESGFKHFEGNSDSHTKALLTGSQLNVIIDDGRLVLGRWQSIYFAEFDGPRHRKIHIKIFKG